VREALKAGTTIDRLVVQKGLSDQGSQMIIDDAKARAVKIFFRDKEHLDRESATGRHQGFVAEITDYKYTDIEIVLSKCAEKEHSLVILLDGIEDPHNLGSILRVAECAGADGVILPKHRSASVNETVIKVSAGASAHVAVSKVTNINDAIRLLKENNFWVYATDMSGDNVYQTKLTGKVALVIGGEGNGVKVLTKKLCDGTLSIPMYGNLNSLNASVACGIVAFEAVRQMKS